MRHCIHYKLNRVTMKMNLNCRFGQTVIILNLHSLILIFILIIISLIHSVPICFSNTSIQPTSCYVTYCGLSILGMHQKQREYSFITHRHSHPPYHRNTNRYSWCFHTASLLQCLLSYLDILVVVGVFAVHDSTDWYWRDWVLGDFHCFRAIVVSDPRSASYCGVYYSVEVGICLIFLPWNCANFCPLVW